MSHDLVTKLENLGLTPEFAQLVIEDSTGDRARAMVAAAQNGTVSQIIAPLFIPTVWRKEELGLHRDHAAFRATLEQGGNRIGNYAGQILVKTPLAKERTTVELFRATGRELGLTKNYTFDELLAAAAKHNLGKLPAESGPALRESYSNQPKGEVVRVCMEPIAVSDENPSVFLVYHDDDDRWLYAHCVNPAYEWDPEALWVFGAAPSKQ